MTRKAQARFSEPLAAPMQQLFGALGGQAAVPFYYNRLANLNRDALGNIVQWADAIRGYSGPLAPPVLVPVIPPGTPAGSFTYDAVKGVVGAGNQGAVLQGALSGAYSLSAGAPGTGITVPRLGTVWVVGEIDAAVLGGVLAAVVNASGSSFCAVGSSATAQLYTTENDQTTLAASAVPSDGTRRLVIMTSTTGAQHGVQVPSQGVVQAGGEVARPLEPYLLQILGPSLAGAGSVAEVGGLFRIATATDIALILANAISMHAAVAA